MKSIYEVMQEYYTQISLRSPQKLKDKTILITGASGLVGSNIISYLSHLNKIHKLNTRIIGIIRNLQEPWLSKGKNIKYLQVDLSKEKLNISAKPHFIIHAATYGQPKKFLEYPEETVQLNINTLFNLLDLAKKNKATFLYLSSAEIYGEADDKHVPTEESYYGYVNTLTERAIYAESKRLAETICYLYSRYIPVKIARLLICYGPGVKFDDKRVYCEFIKRAQSTGTITMMDEGKAERTLCFIVDAVEMLLNIMTNSKEMVYNVCGQGTVTVRELAEKIAKINNATVSGVINIEKIEGTPSRSALSNKRYLREFKKTHFFSLEEGLTATSRWFRNLQSMYEKS